MKSNRCINTAATLQAVYLVWLFLRITTMCNLSVFGLVRGKFPESFAHAQAVDTRPLFSPNTWPGYEARAGLAHSWLCHWSQHCHFTSKPQGMSMCIRFCIQKIQLSVVKAWVRLFCMYLYSINTSMWFIHVLVFLQWLVNIMKLKDFFLSPTQLIRLYLSRDEDGWDCHHQQKQTQKLIGGNYAR